MVDPAALDAVLRRAQGGDVDALRLLAEAYTARLFGLLFRLTRSHETAADLVQETMVRVVRTLGDYQHDGRFEAWLFRIAANLARDAARRSKRRGAALRLEEAREPPLRRAEPDAEMEDSEERQRLRACLAQLPAMDREILMLRHYSDLSFREIAELLGVPLGTALARAHRALARLRTEFDRP
jgi:RNA polymerase sigma-70 factor, ECF subfamily